MPRPRKSSQHSDRVAALKERVEPTVKINWGTPWPEWFVGGADILVPEDIDLATVTRPQYVAALKASVEAGELYKGYLEPEEQEKSWARFERWRDGEHSPQCWCSTACIAKLPKAPAQHSAHVAEAYPPDRPAPGPRPRSREAPRG